MQATYKGENGMKTVNKRGKDVNKSQAPDTNTIKIEDARLVRELVSTLQQQARTSTHEHDAETEPVVPLLGGNPFGVMYETRTRRLRLPKRAPRNNPTWLVELHGLGGGTPPLQLEIAGDTILGIARPGQETPDFDLGPYHSSGKGVSRRHAMLRPSRNRLFIIDLQSTNGTHVNALPVGAGTARNLSNNDTISLGALTFSLKILATAADYEDARAKGLRTNF